ncbi:helix-turn-helix transcriptional regulator [Micromonospora andamanensis]|uniref:DUF5753 domain-containing protein n=1 Tax=Micromonospora andamanensis TaxID=1287068 RepID=UPI001A495EA7|nr:DUF5753 domain-containing protein [Micromonospora andamanensis]GIJ38512.1 hypothetical protein Vwe01_18370 [Micromonospora andamanensis]
MNDALRVALQESGHTTESLAAQIGVDPKTTDRWLRQGRIPHPTHRATAAAILDRDEQDIWPDISRRRLRDLVWFRPWQDIEREAIELRWFEPNVLPGLLQTEAYARAVLSASGRRTPDEVDALVAQRLSRQGILRRESPPWFTAIVDECALRRPVGGPGVMREQLLALADVCSLPHVRLHVVPWSTGAYAGLDGRFVIATSADHRTGAYLDTQLQGQVVSEPGDVAAILAAWEDVRVEALPHRQSVDLVREVAETWT